MTYIGAFSLARQRRRGQSGRRGGAHRIGLPRTSVKPAHGEPLASQTGGGRGGPRPPGLPVWGSTRARTPGGRPLASGIHLLDEGEVLRLRRAVVTDEPPLPVVVADRLPQLGMPLET